jgi:hypothetical protein
VARSATVSTPATPTFFAAAAVAATATTAFLAAAAVAVTATTALAMVMSATGHLKFCIGQIGQEAIGFDQQFGNSDVRHCVFSLLKKLNPTNQVSIVFCGALKN